MQDQLSMLTPMLTLPEQLHTERLVLRAPCAADAAFMFEAYTQDMAVARYMVWRPHRSVLETEAFIAWCMQAWAGGGAMPYVLAFRDNPHRPIGMLEARPSAHTVDMGYVLAGEHWRKGLMSEAIAAMVEAALAQPACFRVQATCHVDNAASARTLEKSGFVREGRLERYAINPNISDEPEPCFMYARCKPWNPFKNAC
jgi:RimJ/RimL family protein N-acetyltransferase